MASSTYFIQLIFHCFFVINLYFQVVCSNTTCLGILFFQATFLNVPKTSTNFCPMEPPTFYTFWSKGSIFWTICNKMVFCSTNMALVETNGDSRSRSRFSLHLNLPSRKIDQWLIQQLYLFLYCIFSNSHVLLLLFFVKGVGWIHGLDGKGIWLGTDPTHC